MISLEMAKKLKENNVKIITENYYNKHGHFYTPNIGVEVYPAASFEELWNLLPTYIDDFYIRIWKSSNTTVISYDNDDRTFLEFDNFTTKCSVEDLLAEMIIELKNKALLK